MTTDQPNGEVTQEENVDQNNPLKSRSFYVSIFSRIWIGFTLAFVIIFVVTYSWLYAFTREIALEQIRQNLISTIDAAVRGVDAEELQKLVAEGVPNASGFSDDPRFISLLGWLEEVNGIEPFAWPYIYVPGEDNDIYYVIDLYVNYDTSRAKQFMERDENPGLQATGFAEMTFYSVAGKFSTYRDKWGEWVAAYAPIMDENGYVVGGMGIDFKVDHLSRIHMPIFYRMVGAFAVAYLLLLVIVFFVSTAFLRPVNHLTQTLEAISEGRYNNIPGQEGARFFMGELDVVSTMAARFTKKMVDREEDLRQENEALQQEVEILRRKLH